MGGLILFVFLGLYLWGCTHLTRWLLRICPWPIAWPRWPRVALYPLVLVLVFVLPVADELLARPKFSSLCEKGAVLKIDAQRIRGRTIRLEIDPSNKPLEGTVIPILHSHYKFIDVSTGQELAWYDIYLARGGLLSRSVGFPEGGSGVTGLGGCSPPKSAHAYADEYGFILIN